MEVQDVIRLARMHVDGCYWESSARLCCYDAIALFAKGDKKEAQQRAIESLKFSVGIFHPDFKKASEQ